MVAPGETDLEQMLASMDVVRRDGTFTFVAVAEPSPDLLAMAHATVRETDTTTLVVTVEVARAARLPVVVEMAWLSLTVDSSLEAVGLTAAFANVLGAQGIACNVLAGYHHDHILVPAGRADDAIAALTAL